MSWQYMVWLGIGIVYTVLGGTGYINTVVISMVDKTSRSTIIEQCMICIGIYILVTCGAYQ